MWETFEAILLSHHPLSAPAYLVLGVILGAIVSTRYAIKSQRPKLLIAGDGSGGNNQSHAWSISIANQPSFFGQKVDGGPARDVNAWLRLNDRDSQSYPIFWNGEAPKVSVTIEAGRQESLRLFHWTHGSSGYVVHDHTGEPVARFQDRRLSFVLRLNDHLSRITEFPFAVQFDDTHLKNVPTLRIVFPVTLTERLGAVGRGLRQIRRAFRRQR